MRALIGLLLVLAACRADAAVPVCKSTTFETVAHIVCSVPRDALIELHLRASDGTPLGQFDTLEKSVGQPLIMAMNAGMYHEDRSPVGLYVQNGEAVSSLVTRPGPGNFGLVPNGVFWSDGKQVHVTETLRFEEMDVTPEFATQSGPMLVIEGALHPRFRPDSNSRKRRNGVGIVDDRVVFAISDAPVTFHHFGRLFRDELGADNALFLDGSISRIYAPELDRSERGSDLGPMVVIVDAP